MSRRDRFRSVSIESMCAALMASVASGFIWGPAFGFLLMGVMWWTGNVLLALILETKADE